MSSLLGLIIIQQQQQQSSPAAAVQEKEQASNKRSGGGGPSFFGGWGGGGGGRSSDKEEASSVNGSTMTEEDDLETMRKKVRSSPEWSKAVKKYKLTGATVGLEDEYLLAGKPERSTSGKSFIWEAYKTNEMGLPVDNAVPDLYENFDQPRGNFT